MELTVVNQEEYVIKSERNGYIDENGAPLKCIYCDCEELFLADERYGGYSEPCGLMEYSVFCKKCTKEVGHWAYGNWSI